MKIVYLEKKSRAIQRKVRFLSYLMIVGFTFCQWACQPSNKEEAKLNRLQYESSQYLRQHASNPIDWYPWGEEALQKAKDENKLLVISIGYYACHWCKVMEEETFTDTTVAKVMNEFFVSIKVDREERPDIDQVYAEAAKKMTGKSGWPLNIIAAPDGTPLFAGTYFENSEWSAITERANYLFQEDPESVVQKAKDFANSIKESQEASGIHVGASIDLRSIKSIWLAQSDLKNGGIRGEEKFPNSPYLSALMDYSAYYPSQELDSFLITTLDRMSLGGLFDHLGGGFARYTTDNQWQIPHFEKMLYDNAQLIGVFSKAYRKFDNPFYLYVAEQSAKGLLRDFKDKNGGYYSSMNADSDGREGGFYTWSMSEISEFDNADQIVEFFSITDEGNWEEGLNVLYTSTADTKSYMEAIPEGTIESMLKRRNRRTPPPKDLKIVTAWNAMVIEGFTELFKATKNQQYLDEAKSLATFLIENLYSEKEGKVFRTTEQKELSFLEDYSHLAGALIELYQVTFEEKWLLHAESITNSALSLFKSEKSKLFKQSHGGSELFMAGYSTLDTDLPSGNAQMARNLLLLSEFFYDNRSDWKGIAQEMLLAETDEVSTATAFTGAWVEALLLEENAPFEVAILGDEALQVKAEMDFAFRPDIVFLGGTDEGTIPLLENKLVDGKTMIYVCQNKTCKFPTSDSQEAYELTLEVN